MSLISLSAYCSTAQLIYEFINMFGDIDAIDQDIADCLYAGITRDRYKTSIFPSVTAKTHEIVAFLISKGHNTIKIRFST